MPKSGEYGVVLMIQSLTYFDTQIETKIKDNQRVITTQQSQDRISHITPIHLCITDVPTTLYLLLFRGNLWLSTELPPIIWLE